MWIELFDFALLARQTVSKAELNPGLYLGWSPGLVIWVDLGWSPVTWIGHILDGTLCESN